eukprot:gene25224-10869_t
MTASKMNVSNAGKASARMSGSLPAKEEERSTQPVIPWHSMTTSKMNLFNPEKEQTDAAVASARMSGSLPAKEEERSTQPVIPWHSMTASKMNSFNVEKVETDNAIASAPHTALLAMRKPQVLEEMVVGLRGCSVPSVSAVLSKLRGNNTEPTSHDEWSKTPVGEKPVGKMPAGGDASVEAADGVSRASSHRRAAAPHPHGFALDLGGPRLDYLTARLLAEHEYDARCNNVISWMSMQLDDVVYRSTGVELVPFDLAYEK